MQSSEESISVWGHQSRCSSYCLFPSLTYCWGANSFPMSHQMGTINLNFFWDQLTTACREKEILLISLSLRLQSPDNWKLKLRMGLHQRVQRRMWVSPKNGSFWRQAEPEMQEMSMSGKIFWVSILEKCSLSLQIARLTNPAGSTGCPCRHISEMPH